MMKTSAPLSFAFLVLLAFLTPSSSKGLDLDPYPVFDFSRDPFSITIFREERPSFYWVNTGIPDFFFKGVQQLSATPNPVVYSVRSIEYGVQAKGWVTDQLQVRTTFPFEANAIVDPSGNTHNAAKFGDMEVGATFLVAGKREKGSFIGVDGWYRFSTGTNPFDLAYPILSTGKGAPEEAIGLIVAEELDGFSFFQSIHYQKNQPIELGPANPFLGAGTFQWPDSVLAEGRVEYLVFHRSQRFVSLYYDLKLRKSGLMEFNGQPLSYGQNPNSQTTDALFFSQGGMVVRVDQSFSVDGSVSYFPFEFGQSIYRPDDGWIFSLSLIFRPI
ncbi:MAG TPA: hypothetical protein VJ873_10780 [bacterium]|nr:hypothetical protein [bacterium]